MTLTTRQKFLIPILIIVLAFLAWEIFSAMKQSGLVVGAASQPSAVLQKPEVPAAPKAMPFNEAESTAVAKPAKLNSDQVAYIQLISQYKRLQMEKLIASNSQAIAEAKLKTAEADEKLASLPDSGGVSLAVQSAKQSMNAYQLVYTGKLQGHWTATLRKGNELIDIAVGNRLEDGSTIVAINSSQVVISNGMKRQTIGFNGVSNTVAHEQKSEQGTSQKLAKSDSRFSTGAHAMQNLISKLESEVKANDNAKIKTKMVKKTKVKVVAKSSKMPVIEISELQPKQQRAVKIAPIAIAMAKDSLTTLPVFPKAIEKKILAKKTMAKKHAEHKQHKFHKAKIIATKYNNSEKMILKMNPKLYTVQLVASFQQPYITRYITKNNLMGRSLQFETKYKNKPWFALVYGQYKDISRALIAIDQMPKSMKAQKPFVRRVDVIQNEIKRQQVA